jgi:tellurite resistance protein
MANNGSNWNAIMQYSFLHVFANDGLIDHDELQMIERLALQDGTVDARERDVLTNVFARVNRENVEPAVWEEIQRFKTQFDIP